MKVVEVGVRAKPQVRNALGLLVVSAIGALPLLSFQALDLIGRASSFLLTVEGIKSAYIYLNNPILTLKLSDGSVLAGSIQESCSGIVSVAIFGVLSALTFGLIPGRFSSKLIWLSAGAAFGVIWNIFRVNLVFMVAYYFGLDAFRLVHYVIGPIIDIFWVVAIWSLAMSSLMRGKKNAGEKKAWSFLTS